MTVSEALDHLLQATRDDDRARLQAVATLLHELESAEDDDVREFAEYAFADAGDLLHLTDEERSLA